MADCTPMTQGQRIYRYEVPVDGRFHTLTIQGELLHIACRRLESVEFWASWTDGLPGTQRTFYVVGTGHAMPEDMLYQGTAVTPGGALVWHLMEVHR